MTVFRRVMAVLWLIVVALVAAALVKIAFFPDSPQVAGPDEPGGEIIEPHVFVSRGTITNDVVLSGSVAADPAVEILSTVTGSVVEAYAKAGDTVTAGQALVKVRGERLDSDGDYVTVIEDVHSPSDGILSSFPTLVGTSTSAGVSIGNVAPPTFNVSGQIPPEQMYRLITRPTDALVTVSGGPAPFTCTDLVILTPLEGDDSGESVSGPTLRCKVPKDVTVFAGLTADVVVAGGVAEDVLVVPTSAVLGAAETGVVWVVLPDGGTEERTVELGMNDGAMVEIVSGVEEGTELLQFVPGAPGGDPGIGIPVDPGKPVQEPIISDCWIDETGVEICEGV